MGSVIYVFGLLYSEPLLNINNNFTGLLSIYFIVVCTVSRRLTLEFAFLEAVNIGVTAYCLPKDETIGEFGYLLQLF